MRRFLAATIRFLRHTLGRRQRRGLENLGDVVAEGVERGMRRALEEAEPLSVDADSVADGVARGTIDALSLPRSRRPLYLALLVLLFLMLPAVWVGSEQIVNSSTVRFTAGAPASQTVIDAPRNGGVIETRGDAQSQWAVAQEITLSSLTGEYLIQLPIPEEDCGIHQDLGVPCAGNGLLQLPAPTSIRWDHPVELLIESSSFDSATLVASSDASISLSVTGSSIRVCFRSPPPTGLTIQRGSVVGRWEPTVIREVVTCDKGLQLEVDPPSQDPPQSGLQISQIERMIVKASGDTIEVSDGRGEMNFDGFLRRSIPGSPLTIVGNPAVASLELGSASALSVTADDATSVHQGAVQHLPSLRDRERDLVVVAMGALLAFILTQVIRTVERWPRN